MGKLGQFLRRGRQGDTAEGNDPQEGTSPDVPLSDLGQLLRNARTEKRVTLDVAEQETRIRQKYLLALEEGRYDDLPTPGHIHGFLRNYALYLGLDVKEVEALYAKDRAGHRVFEPGIFHPKNISLMPKKPLVRADLILGIVLVLLLAILGWAFWQYAWPVLQPAVSAIVATATPQEISLEPSATSTSQVSRSTATATPASPTATATDSPTATATTETTPTPTPTLDAPLTLPTPTSRPTRTPTPTPTPQGGVSVHFEFIDRVWLQATVDGQESRGELFETGEEKEWRGRDTIYVICGNAGGVLATVNGVEVGVLGARAEVVEKTWGPEGEISATPQVTTTPTPTKTQ